MDDTAKGDETDSVESSASIGVVGGLTLGGDQAKLNDAKAGADFEAKDTLRKNPAGRLEKDRSRQGVANLKLPFEMTLAGLKVKAEYELKWSGGDGKAEHSLTVGIGGEADLAIPGAAVWTALTKIVDLTLAAADKTFTPEEKASLRAGLVGVPHNLFLQWCLQRSAAMKQEGAGAEFMVEFAFKRSDKWELEIAGVNESKVATSSRDDKKKPGIGGADVEAGVKTKAVICKHGW